MFKEITLDKLYYICYYHVLWMKLIMNIMIIGGKFQTFV